MNVILCQTALVEEHSFKVGQGQQFPRPPRILVGHISLAADGQQQRMHAGCVDGVDRVDARNGLRDDRPDQLVDQLAEHRVFLRRAAHHRERPDRPRRDDRRARPAAPGNRGPDCSSPGDRRTAPRACGRSGRAGR